MGILQNYWSLTKCFFFSYPYTILVVEICGTCMSQHIRLLKNSLNLLNVVSADRLVPSCVRSDLAMYLGAKDGEVVVGSGAETVGGKDADWASVSASIVKGLW